MPGERASAAATERRRRGRGDRPSTPRACVSSITSRPPASAGDTRECRQRRRAPARGTETVGHDQRPLAGAARLAHPALERIRVAMREGLDR